MHILRHRLPQEVLEPKERLDELVGEYSNHKRPTIADSPYVGQATR